MSVEWRGFYSSRITCRWSVWACRFDAKILAHWALARNSHHDTHGFLITPFQKTMFIFSIKFHWGLYLGTVRHQNITWIDVGQDIRRIIAHLKQNGLNIINRYDMICVATRISLSWQNNIGPNVAIFPLQWYCMSAIESHWHLGSLRYSSFKVQWNLSITTT